MKITLANGTVIDDVTAEDLKTLGLVPAAPASAPQPEEDEGLGPAVDDEPQEPEVEEAPMTEEEERAQRLRCVEARIGAVHRKTLQEVRDYYPEGVHYEVLAKDMGITRAATSERLRQLQRAGLVERLKRGTYRPVQF